MIMPISTLSYISKEFTNYGEHMDTNLEDSSEILGTGQILTRPLGNQVFMWGIK